MNYQENHWDGSYYELGVIIEPYNSQDKIISALNCIINSNLITGLWIDRKDTGIFEKSFLKSHFRSLKDLQIYNYYSEVKILDYNPIGCLIIIIQDGINTWFDLCIPLEMLDLIVEVEYPLYTQTNPWIFEVDSFFIKIADLLSSNLFFDFAMIGEEISGYMTPEELTVEELKKSGYLLSDRYRKKFNTVPFKMITESGLYWYPNKGIQISFDPNSRD